VNRLIFFAVGLLATTAAASVKAQHAPGPFDDIVKGTAASPSPRFPLASLPTPPEPTAPLPTAQLCYEVIQPNISPFAPILLDRCTGFTWVLIRHPLTDARGRATSQFIYRWAPLGLDSTEAVLGGGYIAASPPR
jgi:hypothetical protein